MPASKWFEKAPMRMMSLLLKGREKWELVLKVHMGVVALIPQLPLVAPRAKVTEPVQSKLNNRMTIMMTMRIFPWTRSQPLSFGHQDLLVQQLKWVFSRRWTTQGVSQCVQGKVH
jgi:hypothetical protein